ncbi:MAG: tetratricopeptide repeat protein [Polyangiaceae bacterium]|nr:tetratricopeptide repeat protein [Polyangiaceae bacterium]
MKHPGRMVAAALALLFCAATHANAEPTAEDRAAAESLFREALALIQTNKYSDACPKLEASNKLDPAVGTLFNLADCYEHTGRTASAWSTFGEARRLAERMKDRRATDAAQREKALENNLPKLIIKVSEKVDGLVVKRDNKPLDAALLESAVPVDSGKHTVEVTAPGREPWSTTVDVPDKPGEVTVQIPPLAAARSAAPTASASASASGQPDTPPSGMSGQKIAGIVVAGVGVAGLAVGGVFGGLTLSAVGATVSEGHCVEGKPVRCDAEGLSARKDAEVTANISNIALAVGGAAVIGGVVLYLVAPSPQKSTGSMQLKPHSKAAKTTIQSVQVSPWLGNVNGLSVTGSF